VIRRLAQFLCDNSASYAACIILSKCRQCVRIRISSATNLTIHSTPSTQIMHLTDKQNELSNIHTQFWAPERCVHDKALHKSTFTLPYTVCEKVDHQPIAASSSNLNWQTTSSFRKATVRNESSYRPLWSLADPEIIDGNNGRPSPGSWNTSEYLAVNFAGSAIRAWTFLICEEVSRPDTITCTDAGCGRIPTSWIRRRFWLDFYRTERRS